MICGYDYGDNVLFYFGAATPNWNIFVIFKFLIVMALQLKVIDFIYILINSTTFFLSREYFEFNWKYF